MLDIKTLILLNVIINFTNVLVLSLIWQQSHKKFQGITFLLIAMISQTTGFFFILLQGVIPDLISIVFANAFIATAALLILIGMQIFFGKEKHQIHNYILMFVYILSLIYFSFIEPNWNVRAIIISAVIIIINAQIFHLLYYKVDSELQTLAKLSAIVFLSYAFISLIRITFIVKFPFTTSDFFNTGLLSSISLIAYMVLSILITTSFILLINRRLLLQVGSQEKKYNALFFASPYAMMITSLTDGRILEINNKFTSLMGYTWEDIIGKTTLGLNMWKNKEENNQNIEKLYEFKKVKGLELELRKKNGEFMNGLVSSEIIFINDKKCILTSISDITEISLMKKVLQEIAMHDSLTQLPNRLLFFDRLEVALSNAQRGNKKIAIVFIDLDHLKYINDKYGHEMGDELLKAVGNIFKYAIRKVDTVARFGGDEFVVILWDVGNKDNVVKIIKNIQDKFLDPIRIQGNEFKISLSIGISLFPEDGNVKEALIANADKAMYKVKETTRDDFQFYDKDEI